MDSQKLRIKVGEHEFEAEGSSEKVSEQFNAWKELIASLPQKAQGGSTPPQNNTGKLLKNVTEVRTSEGFSAPWDIFQVDDKRKLVTLAIHPSGDDRDALAMLLIMFGHKKSYGQNEVLATRLVEAMEVSGFKPGRIDRTLAKFIDAGLVLNSGRGKGSKYRLTNTGYAQADELARQLFATVNIPE